MEYSCEAPKHQTLAQTTAAQDAGNRCARLRMYRPAELYSTLDLLRWAGECEGFELERAPVVVAAKVPEPDPEQRELLRWAGECEAVGLEQEPTTKGTECDAASELLTSEEEAEEEGERCQPASSESSGAPETGYDMATASPQVEGKWGECETVEFEATFGSSTSADWGECEDLVLQSAPPAEERSDSEADLQLWELKPAEPTKEDDEPSTRASTRPSTQPPTQPSTPPPLSPRSGTHRSHLLLFEVEREDVMAAGPGFDDDREKMAPKKLTPSALAKKELPNEQEHEGYALRVQWAERLFL